MRHNAFESEIAANKPRLEKLKNKAAKLIEEKPESREVVGDFYKLTLVLLCYASTFCYHTNTLDY